MIDQNQSVDQPRPLSYKRTLLSPSSALCEPSTTFQAQIPIFTPLPSGQPASQDSTAEFERYQGDRLFFDNGHAANGDKVKRTGRSRPAG
jgi:hypothetical protein